jgi:hypothetical protein
MSSRAAMALASHSGWAALVAVGGTHEQPQVLARSRVELIDHRDPKSKQPYHAVEGMGIEEAARCLDGYMTVAVRLGHAAVYAAADDLATRGHRVQSVGILESAGRKASSLASILASHALIHAADGDHFRDALAAGAERCGLKVFRVRVRDLEAQAEADLRRPARQLRLAVQKFGRELGAPWGADQKMSALLAWLLLAREG